MTPRPVSSAVVFLAYSCCGDIVLDIEFCEADSTSAEAISHGTATSDTRRES